MSTENFNLADVVVRTITARNLTKKDIIDMTDIEYDSFSNPWDSDDFARCFKRKNTIGIFLCKDSTMLGYAIIEIFKEYMQLVNFVIKPDFRRMGLGTKLVAELTDQLNSSKRKKIALDMRETNLQAQLFFRACKFRATEVHRHSYEDTGEDAYKMEYRTQWPQRATKQDKKGPYAAEAILP